LFESKLIGVEWPRDGWGIFWRGADERVSAPEPEPEREKESRPRGRGLGLRAATVGTSHDHERAERGAHQGCTSHTHASLSLATPPLRSQETRRIHTNTDKRTNLFYSFTQKVLILHAD